VIFAGAPGEHEDAPESDREEFWRHTLPPERCRGCARVIPRRRHRVIVRASWRAENDVMCVDCWRTVCQWAARFALQQSRLPNF